MPDQPHDPGEAPDLARMVREVREAVAAAPDQSAPTMRPIRRRVSDQIAAWPPEAVLELAARLVDDPGPVRRWFVYETIHHHARTLARLDRPALERLGHGMAHWGEVDPFAGYLAGVAWRAGRITDEDVHAWARSPDRWWRRAALVSTVPLNTRARGGHGDARRTLAVCALLEADRDDMVVKALSWALRALARRDRDAVARYLERRAEALPARVRREVGTMLRTGRKNPKRKPPR